MITKPVNISAAERKLLREICYEVKSVEPHVVAAKQLVSKELARWGKISMLHRLIPTPAGREVNELSE